MAVSDEVVCGLRIVREVQAAIAANVLPRSPTSTQSVVLVPPPTVIGRTEPPTAFVSWAHSHSTWTTEQTSDWESQVATFAALLRRLGIPADVDLFHLDEPQDWTRYGPQQVQEAKFTLVVMSRAWAERWSGTNSPREGAGAAAEADTLKGLFARDQEAWQRRIVLIMFPEVESDVVPPDLQRVARVPVDPVDPDSYEAIIRMLTEQPRYPQPPVGDVPLMDAAAGYGESTELVKLRGRLSDIEKRKSKIQNRTSAASEVEREQLNLSESATRGFIDAELTIDS